MSYDEEYEQPDDYGCPDCVCCPAEGCGSFTFPGSCYEHCPCVAG